MFKKTLVALAVAAATAPATAAIDDALSGNGELFLAVSNWTAASETSRVTYAFDTGIKMNDFLPASGAAGTGFTTALTGWSTFLSTLATAGGSTADLRFALFALDTTGTSAFGSPNSRRVLTTSTGNAASVIAPGDGVTAALQNVDLTTINASSSKISLFLAGTNALASHSSTANGWSVNVRQGATDTADFGNAFLDSIGFEGSQINFTTGAALNSSIGFLYAGNSSVGPSSGYGNRVANVIDYAEASFSVLDNGTLVYSVAAIPEPGELAFMLSGLALAGMVARRRAARRA
jgi:hypothetical protein